MNVSSDNPFSMWVRGLDEGSFDEGTNADATLVYPVPPLGASYINISGILWSYSQPPTGGGLILTETNSGHVWMDIDITQDGPGQLLFNPVRRFEGPSLTITLRAGGAGIVGKLSVI